MTEVVRRERKPRARSTRPSTPKEMSPPSTENGEGSEAASELLLARRVALVTPVVTLVAAGVVGATLSLGPALLVLAGGALFGTIAFFWASLRTLGGEAPLAEGFELMSTRRVESPDGAAERKRTALRALKDLELERSIGKIDEADYAELSSRYREEAKAILREMDRDVGPLRERAEVLARKYLAKHGADPGSHAESDPARDALLEPEGPVAEERPPSRRACLRCKASNEVDAVFCKSCGTRVSPRTCPSCAVRNEPDAEFCKKCGKPLDAAPEGEPSASA